MISYTNRQSGAFRILPLFSLNRICSRECVHFFLLQEVWVKRKKILRSASVGIIAILLVISGLLGVQHIQSVRANTQATSSYTQHFLTLYNEIKNPANGYFSPLGIPYHSVETLIVEAPDYGHETTSETFSFWLWLEATYGQVSGN